MVMDSGEVVCHVTLCSECTVLEPTVNTCISVVMCKTVTLVGDTTEITKNSAVILNSILTVDHACPSLLRKV